MPRPKLPDAKRRSEVLQIRLTTAQRELLDRAADLLEEPLSDLIRDAALAKARRVLKTADAED